MLLYAIYIAGVCHPGLNTDINKIQIEVKHRYTVRSYKGPVCEMKQDNDKSATENIISWTESVRFMPVGRHISVCESSLYQMPDTGCI